MRPSLFFYAAASGQGCALTQDLQKRNMLLFGEHILPYMELHFLEE